MRPTAIKSRPGAEPMRATRTAAFLITCVIGAGRHAQPALASFDFGNFLAEPGGTCAV